MIFCKEKVNLKRQPEIDLARGFSSLLIILCHVGLYLGNPNDKIVYTFSDIAGSEFGAPAFLALMGISIAFSKCQDPKPMLIRGIKLFIGGYLLSAFRTVIPRIILGNIDEWTDMTAFFAVDIFQIAGLTFMFLALLKAIKIPSWGIFGISIVMVGIDQIFFKNPLNIKNMYLCGLVDLFIPVTQWSCFPFLTWFFFPAFGLFFGEFLIRCTDKKKLYAVLLPISTCAVAYVYYSFYKLYPDYPTYYYGGNFYYMGIINVLINALFITFGLSFWFLTQNFWPKFIKQYLTFLGRNLTVFYVFTWMFVAPMIHINAKLGITFGTLTSFLMMIVYLAVCALCTKAYLIITKKIKTAKEQKV